ncbi:MAG: hypothetical protein PHT30_04980 [Bacilli bacterium]|nr:hypothetical protein [Bacilli bacterium]
MKFDVKLARRMAREELSKKSGADILIDGKPFNVKNATLEELETAFPNVQIFHVNGYWEISKREDA